MRFLSTFLALCVPFTSLVTAADTAAWKSRSIYFVLTDRIAQNSATTTACGNLKTYCGGTFKGLQSKLDYISGLGFDSIWITPVVTSMFIELLAQETTTDRSSRQCGRISWILGTRSELYRLTSGICTGSHEPCRRCPCQGMSSANPGFVNQRLTNLGHVCYDRCRSKPHGQG